MIETEPHNITERTYPYREGNHYYPDPDTCIDLPTGIKRGSTYNDDKEGQCDDWEFWLTPPTTSTFTRTTTEAQQGELVEPVEKLGEFTLKLH